MKMKRTCIYVNFFWCCTESILPRQPVEYYTDLYDDQLAISYVNFLESVA